MLTETPRSVRIYPLTRGAWAIGQDGDPVRTRSRACLRRTVPLVAPRLREGAGAAQRERTCPGLFDGKGNTD